MYPVEKRQASLGRKKVSKLPRIPARGGGGEKEALGGGVGNRNAVSKEGGIRREFGHQFRERKTNKSFWRNRRGEKVSVPKERAKVEEEEISGCFGQQGRENSFLERRD